MSEITQFQRIHRSVLLLSKSIQKRSSDNTFSMILMKLRRLFW